MLTRLSHSAANPISLGTRIWLCFIHDCYFCVNQQVVYSNIAFFYLFYKSLQLSGGTASMQQLKERLEKDLLEVQYPINVSFSQHVLVSFLGERWGGR